MEIDYDLFYKECNKNNIDYLLLGHHKDDLIENLESQKVRINKKNKNWDIYLNE